MIGGKLKCEIEREIDFDAVQIDSGVLGEPFEMPEKKKRRRTTKPKGDPTSYEGYARHA